MSLETRSNSALFKRAEQLKRWDESDTNRESTTPRKDRRKVKFSAGCVFLAACAAGDREEVQRLIQNGADIDTANVDGLTALHQACIDDNLEMVEFLVSRGADVNRGDNEGWTPLHATASCGFLSIARLLMERGADVAAVNNDGELPLDIAESDEMEFLLFSNVTALGIDCDAARNKEERLMLADAKQWLKSGEVCDKPHPKTGATALHVAAAKGYKKVIDILLQAGSDVNAQDLDGWTALHAASHWAQREACEVLVDSLCDMDIKNYVGQTAEDVADPDLVSWLDELRKKQAVLLRGRGAILPPAKRSSSALSNQAGKRRSLDNNISVTPATTNNNNISQHDTNNQQIMSSVTRMSVADKSSLLSKDVSAERQLLARDEETTSTSEESEIEKRNRANRGDTTPNKSAPFPAPSSPPNPPLDSDESGIPSWRRPGSVRSRSNGKEDTRTSSRDRNSVETSEVVLRRTHSFESDDNEKRESAQSAPASPAKAPPASPTSLNAPAGQVRRSFVPPVRDEESETQRKAHAKRVRETRRSTQGVTLEEIKSAEQLVKSKQAEPQSTTAEPRVPVEAAVAPEESGAERRPSWRLKVDSGSKFLLEDARGASESSGAAAARRAAAATRTALPENHVDTSVSVALRRAAKPAPAEDKDQDKENDSRNAQATQAVIQRRRRPKRRSTGVVHVDMDEIDPERQEGGTGDAEEVKPSEESDRSSRLSSISSQGAVETAEDTDNPENGELDYKKLYEESRVENERLRLRLRRVEDDLKITKSEQSGAKSTLSESEKRERRAMERKLSEMEEELKIMENLKKENQKLKDENGALIRVISKLSK